MRIFVFYVFLFISSSLVAQEFGRSDSLRGYLSPIRSCYDVTYYHLDINVDPEEKFIKGYTEIHFNALESFQIFQIDLFENMNISQIIYKEKELDFTREFNAVFVDFKDTIELNTQAFITVFYDGYPREAINAPWDGGFSWKKDKNDKDWIGVSCQGLGASSWWPNKDHQSDEPDSMLISCQIPYGLTCVSNGNLRLHDLRKSTMHFNTFHWFVSYPINNYDVSVNIGDYVHFGDKFISQSDTLSLDYYVLSYNEDKARKQFEQVKPMLRCFEEYLGPYPFFNDGYALIETPYLGMEHQSGIAYGNDYKPGYKGNTDFIAGLDFDYIIIHETGHEWWGNSITANDISDMWIQETFCTYSEVLYVECIYGYDAMIKYVKNQMSMARNARPIVGVPDVHSKGSSDMYAKGSAVMHTVRSLVENDSLWFDLIKTMTNHFKYQTIDGRDVLNYINQKSGKNFDNIFQQYLYNSKLPVFEYYFTGFGRNKKLNYRWKAIESFNMPIKVRLDGNFYKWVYPTSEWQQIRMKGSSRNFKIAQHLFLIDSKKIK
ncbi:MAG: M1 family metallopeptidase [Flavobacteriales bacterium]|jgi:aminopeptidase N